MSRRPVGSVDWLIPNEKARIRVSGGVHPVTGKRWRLTEIVYGNERQVEAALARLLLQAGKVPESDVSVRQFLEQMWLPHVEARVRARTYDGYKSKIDNHITPVLGSVPLAGLSPYQLDRWIDGVKGSERSRLHCYRVLNAALNLAVRWRLLEHNPLRAVTAPKPRLEAPDVLSVKEANAYLDAFAGHTLEPLIVLALGAGLRRSELAGLRWSDMDLDAATVTVSRGLHDRGSEVIVEEPKSATSHRIVALPAWAVAVLRPHRGIGPLVVEGGLPMRPWRISALYERHVASCGLRRVPLRNLRHSHACLLLEAGVDLYTVSRRLGHSTVAVTEAHYVRPGEAADRAAADAFGRVLKPVPKRPKAQRGPN